MSLGEMFNVMHSFLKNKKHSSPYRAREGTSGLGQEGEAGAQDRTRSWLFPSTLVDMATQGRLTAWDWLLGITVAGFGL